MVTTWLVDLTQPPLRGHAETRRMAEDGARTAIARGSLLDLEDAEMMLGTTLFFFPQGTEESERAGTQLYRYRELATQTNDHVFQIDAAGMLSTWHRLRGDVEQARRYATEVLSVGAGSQVVKYRAEAHGNLAWAAWRAGDKVGAENRGRFRTRRFPGAFSPQPL